MISLSDSSLSIRKIGHLRNVRSSEIVDSHISVGVEGLDRELFDFDRAVHKLFEAGAKYARIQTGWNRCETQKGVFSFEWLDHVVDTLLAGGVRPWFNVGFGNPLYMPDAPTPTAVGCVPLYYGEETLHAWKRFVAEVAKHYKGRIHHWEIWNEPNCDQFWYPKGCDANDYGKLISITAPIIKEIIPNAQIGACSSNHRPDYDFHLQFLNSSCIKDLDFLAIHHYQIIPEKQWDMVVKTYKRQFSQLGNPNIQIWQGEAGYPSWSPPNHWMKTYVKDSELNQAKWLLRRYVVDLGNGIEKSSFFQLVDLGSKLYQMARLSQAKPAKHGLLDCVEYKPKLSHKALSHLTPIFDIDTYSKEYFCFPELFEIIPREVQVSKLMECAVYIRTFERKGFALYAYYLPEDVQLNISHNHFSLAIIHDEAPNALEEPILIDPLYGDVFELPKDNLNLFKDLPLFDYPLFITDKRSLTDRINFFE